MNTPISTHIKRIAQIAGTWSGGTTHALYAHPSDSLRAVGSGLVWIGTATIDRSADYSFFPGRIRVHVPIKGNGLRLHFAAPDEVVTLPTFTPYRFDGTRPVHAELIDGPVLAFNLITRTDVEATVRVLSLDQDAVLLSDQITPQLRAHTSNERQALHLLYVISGSLMITSAEKHALTLHEDEAFVYHNSLTLQHLEPQTTVIAVDLLV